MYLLFETKVLILFSDMLTEDLKARQDFLDAMLPMLPEDIRESETVSDSSLPPKVR